MSSFAERSAGSDRALSTQAELRDVTTSTGVHRLRFVDGLRGLAAVYVVISHVWDTTFAIRTPANSSLRSATAFLGFGRYAVALFIIVSGFSIGLGAWKGGLRWPGGIKTYARRRFTRIWPPYAIAVLISSAVAATVLSTDDGTLFDQANQIRPSGVLTHLLLFQDVHWAGPAGSSAFWSIPVEFHIYFFFLLVLAVMRWRLGSWMPSVIALMALTVAATLLPSVPVLRWLGGLSPSLYALFIVGFAAAASAAAGAHFAPRRWHAFLAAMFALGCVAILLCRSQYAPLSPLNDFLIGPAVALLLTQIVTGRLRRLRRALGARFTVWLGDCSYSMYLIHAIVIEIVWRVAVAPVTTNPGLRLVLELVLGVTASVVIGRAFYNVFERPFLRANRPTKPATSQRKPTDDERPRRAPHQPPRRVPA